MTGSLSTSSVTQHKKIHKDSQYHFKYENITFLLPAFRTKTVIGT
jgi:hypothetical protein